MTKDENVSVIKNENMKESEEKLIKLEITAIIPLRAHAAESVDTNETLIRRCAESIRESANIKNVVISADNEKLFSIAGRFRNARSVLRPRELSDDNVRLSEVLKYTLGELHRERYIPDIIVPVDVTYPFRPPGILDSVVEMLLSGDFDTVMAGFAEYRACWKTDGGELAPVIDSEKRRQERDPLRVGLPGLACAVYPSVIEKGMRCGKKVGIYEIDDPFAALEVRTSGQLERIAKHLYWSE